MSDTYSDVMQIELGESGSLQHAVSMQRLINSGTCWRLQGSTGRLAMSMIESGLCMTGLESRQDYWGNTVPGRELLKQGTKGTSDFVIHMQGEAWLQALLKGEGQ